MVPIVSVAKLSAGYRLGEQTCPAMDGLTESLSNILREAGDSGRAHLRSGIYVTVVRDLAGQVID